MSFRCFGTPVVISERGTRDQDCKNAFTYPWSPRLAPFMSAELVCRLRFAGQARSHQNPLISSVPAYQARREHNP